MASQNTPGKGSQGSVPQQPAHRPALGLDGIKHALGNSPQSGRTWPRRFAAYLAATLAISVGVGALMAPVAMTAVVTGNSVMDYWDDLPTDLPLEASLPQHTVLLDKDGKEFARFYSENRIDVKLDQINPSFTDALIATEDSRFYEHQGADATGIMRAAVHNSASGDRQGASTITQQLVQNILVNSARDETEEQVAVGTTPNDKIREIKYAIALEKDISKDEILERYSNTVYFGNLAYGVEAAARTYFDTTAAKLTPAQSAMLVGLLRGPAYYDPFEHPEEALVRRNTVLDRTHQVGSLTDEEWKAARAEPIAPKRGSLPNSCGKSEYPFYCDMVAKEILSDPAFGETEEQRVETQNRGGMTITTALDRQAIDSANAAVYRAMNNENSKTLSVASVVPGSGQIAAIAQNRAWGEGPGKTELPLAEQPYSVGSTIKPITLAAALDKGVPATTRFDAPGRYTPPGFENVAGGTFNNFGYVDLGVIDARQAIKVSSNTYFIKLVEQIGVQAFADMAARLGIERIRGQIHGPTDYVATLGNVTATPLEMANAYATFASGGTECRPHTIVTVKRSDTGEELPAPDPQCHQAISRAVANTVTNSLEGPMQEGGTVGPAAKLKDREAGVKTGTTGDEKPLDNWSVGVTPQLSTAVWLGDPRGGTQNPLDVVEAYGTVFTNLTGAEVATPVWKETMDGALAGKEAVPMPEADDAGTLVSSSTSVPDVRGMSMEAAATVLRENNLVPVIETKTAPANPSFEPNVVMAQTPDAGTGSNFGLEVRLTLSDGSDTSIRPPEKKQ